jgi:hypothetical protein
MRNNLQQILPLAALALVALPAARADIFFNFNTLTQSANNGAIKTYMNGQAGCNNCVSSVGSGALADNTYTGDGFVVGPGGVALTLATTEGAVYNALPPAPEVLAQGTRDMYLRNSGGEGAGQDRVSITFNIPIYTVSFDYEIFPDGSGTTPDFTFATDLNSNIFTMYGVAPNASSYTYKQSSHSTNEAHMQYLGTWSGTVSVGQTGATRLDFIDWPETIGIDNLCINCGMTPVPEPASLAFLGTAICGFALLLKRRSKA